MLASIIEFYPLATSEAKERALGEASPLPAALREECAARWVARVATAGAARYPQGHSEHPRSALDDILEYGWTIAADLAYGCAPPRTARTARPPLDVISLWRTATG